MSKVEVDKWRDEDARPRRVDARDQGVAYLPFDKQFPEEQEEEA